MIQSMNRIEVAALKDVFPQLLSFLHEQGVVHIEPLTEVPSGGRVARLHLSEEEEEEHGKLRSILEAVTALLDSTVDEGDLERVRRLEATPTRELFLRFQELTEELGRRKARHQELLEERRLLPHWESLVDAFLSIQYAFARRADWSMMGLILDRAREHEVDALRNEIARVTKGRMELSVATLDPTRLAALVFYEERFERDLERLIWGKGVDHLTLPRKYLGKPLDEVLTEISVRQRAIPREIAEAEAAYRDLLAKSEEELVALRELARLRSKELSTRTAFVQSSYTVGLIGWVPQSAAAPLRRGLEELFGDRVFVSFRPPRPEEWATVPVALSNPSLARPFELLLLPMRRPRYGGLDPTILLALFFPIFFGIMVGDIGHGAVILLGGWAVGRWFPRVPGAVSSILMTMGGSAIAFGFLFGELFGDLGKGWLRPLLFDRTERMISYLWLALAIGVAHVLLGHLLGIIGALRLRKPRQATERAATMAAIFGGLLLLGAGVKLIPSGWFTPGLILMLAMVPVLLYAGGLVALLELVSTAGHILSYARLMALGVAGAMLAHVANTLGSTEGNVVLGILVALLLHLLHLVMSLFSPTIQALRLHYVEFFSKFYEPGGVPYAPFRK